MPAPSFLDILTEKIRETLRAEVRAEIQAEVEAKLGRRTSSEPPPAAAGVGTVESWLLTHAGKTVFTAPPSARKAYGGSARTQAPPPPPPLKHARATTAEEIFAFEFLVRHADDKNVDPNAFTEAELKALWRQAALNTHPDRHAQTDGRTQTRMSEAFAEITEAYNGLRALFRD